MQIKKKGLIYKVLLIGDSGVGKTSLIMAALEMEFNVKIPSTIEAGNTSV
jgi:GTPase SAR1 family protein